MRPRSVNPWKHFLSAARYMGPEKYGALEVGRYLSLPPAIQRYTAFSKGRFAFPPVTNNHRENYSPCFCHFIPPFKSLLVGRDFNPPQDVLSHNRYCGLNKISGGDWEKKVFHVKFTKNKDTYPAEGTKHIMATNKHLTLSFSRELSAVCASVRDFILLPSPKPAAHDWPRLGLDIMPCSCYNPGANCTILCPLAIGMHVCVSPWVCKPSSPAAASPGTQHSSHTQALTIP